MLTHPEFERIKRWAENHAYWDNEDAQRDIELLIMMHEKLYAENELIKRSYLQLLAFDEKEGES